MLLHHVCSSHLAWPCMRDGHPASQAGNLHAGTINWSMDLHDSFIFATDFTWAANGAGLQNWISIVILQGSLPRYLQVFVPHISLVTKGKNKPENRYSASREGAFDPAPSTLGPVFTEPASSAPLRGPAPPARPRRPARVSRARTAPWCWRARRRRAPGPRCCWRRRRHHGQARSLGAARR